MLYPAGHPLNPASLKDKQRTIRDNFAPPLALRVHRALSWVTRAELEDAGERWGEGHGARDRAWRAEANADWVGGKAGRAGEMRTWRGKAGKPNS